MKRDVLHRLRDRIDDLERQLDELKRIDPTNVLEIKKLEHAIYDFQLQEERESERLRTKVANYKRYDCKQAQLQENEYARVQAEEQEEQAHKRPRL